jgi:hypothetical protein
MSMLRNFIRARSVIPYVIALGIGVTSVLMVSATPVTAQHTRTIRGDWNLYWVGASDTYSGTIQIQRGSNDNVYEGTVTLKPSKGGTVTEDATITVSHSDVSIECSNPRVVDKPGTTTWYPDRFYLKRAGDSMAGYSLDTNGQRGPRVTLTRR